MRPEARALPLLALIAASVAVAEPGGVKLSDAMTEMPDLPPDATVAERCLSCHLTPSGGIDIVGLAAMEALPEEWPFLFEDAFDLDGDGIAGRMRFVSGEDGPERALFGEALAAGSFEDFAQIAAAAHAIEISNAAVMAEVRAAFEARSLDPALPDPAALARFEARGCAGCHVTETFDHAGHRYMPMSDFLLHDLGDGPRRTAPLWGCPDCLDATTHPGTLPPH